ncbi:MAG: FHA domain-containing protein [Myxococcales bacterium]|nr:FHA domain-containing protein [Myxococcales bacterium]
MDATAHYRHLLQLGREEFLASSAPAVLVRYRSVHDSADGGAATLTLDQDEDEPAETIEETLPHGKDFAVREDMDLEVYPLAKKPGASFPDRITIGRTPNNDIVIVDHSVSRLHAYVRLDGKTWTVADAGSKNGSWLDRSALDARKERRLASKSILRVGDVDLTFFLAADLFTALGGL